VDGLDGLRAVFDGEVIGRDDAGYHAVRVPALARFHAVRPRAVAQCASFQDVSRALAFARETGLHIVPRGGGHCFAGRSSTDGLVLDMSRLDEVSVVGDGLARIGAGARLAQVYDALHEHHLTVPAGCGPTVGIAGLTLGGGLGLLGRRYGLTCDRLVAATVVLADGQVLACGEHREPDLFWALRGAGGGQFGVVTSLVFATVPEPAASRFVLTWAAEHAAAVVGAWQDWAPDAPEDASANLTVTARGGEPPRVVIYGAVLRPAEAAHDLIGELVAAVGAPPAVSVRDDLTYPDLKRSFADLDPRDEGSRVTTSKSEFIGRSLPDATISQLLDGLSRETVPDERRELNFTPMGGAYNRVPADATAFAHRSERFLLEHVAAGEDSGWVRRSWAVAHPHASGRVYPNFPDPDLSGWAEAYHGPNFARLAAVKRVYDPDRLFHFPQSL
jgi:FAD/FMN-containing dehydrogenase